MFRGNYEYRENPRDELKGIARNITFILERLDNMDNRIELMEQNQKAIKDQLSEKPEYLSVGEVALMEGVVRKQFVIKLERDLSLLLRMKGNDRIKSLVWNTMKRIPMLSLKAAIAVLAKS